MRPPDHMRHDFDDVYLVYELMDTDLHQIIRSPQVRVVRAVRVYARSEESLSNALLWFD